MLSHYIQEISAEVEKRFGGVQPQPRNLYDPISYILSNGGKRIRAVMVLAAANAFCSDYKKALPQAVGIEVFHNFTLLHDDIMDNAVVRRGVATVHKKWNDNVAILSGDAMMIRACQLMIENNPPRIDLINEIFYKTALEVCEGQQLDMEFETVDLHTTVLTEEQYLTMIRLKTSVLLAASLQIGALLGGASETDAQILYNFGINIGLAFQLQDDLLDTFGNEATFGKRIGGDIVEGKKTFLLIKALERGNAEDVVQLKLLINSNSLPEAEKIEQVRAIYARAQVAEETEKRVAHYFSEADTLLATLQIADIKKTDLFAIANYLKMREK